MIEVKTGDLLKSKSHALVNTVNCVGVMGKGVALAFKKRYPAMYEDYLVRCERGDIRLGEPYIYEAEDGHIIVNFPTKHHWRAVSRLTDIVAGLDFLREHYREWGIRSIALPPLGCGNGQLEWRVVGPTLFRELATLPIPVELYAPHGTPPDQMQLSFFTDAGSDSSEEHSPEPFIEPAWVAIVEVLSRVQSRRYRWPVGRVRFQKIAYFLTSLGVPTGLGYERGSYGPYAVGLKRVISRMVNNGLIREERLGQMIESRVGPTYEDARDAFAGELSAWDPAIGRVADLFVRMRTDQAEIAASVHFVAAELHASLGRRPSEVEILDEVLQWKIRRRPPLAAADVIAALENLALHRWIDVEPSPELHDDEDEMAV